MRIAIYAAVMSSIAFNASGATPELKTDEQKTLYAIGLATSANLSPYHLNPAELALVEAGLSDGVLGKPPGVDLKTFMPKMQELYKTRLTAVVEREKKAGKAYVDKAAQESGVSKTKSGVLYSGVNAGTGESPDEDDTVKVRYEGKLIDGTEFDSSVKQGQPATFAVDRVIPCWKERLQHMKVGERGKLVCPPDTAYGDRGLWPQVPPGATLVFDIELLEILKRATPRE